MKPIIHTLLVNCAVALGALSVKAAAAPPQAAHARATKPEKLWDGFSLPVGMAFDKAGHLYVAEWGASRPRLA
ncbi:MAG: hypothetical protein ABI478_08990 [Propionivibrio sp.]